MADRWVMDVSGDATLTTVIAWLGLSWFVLLVPIVRATPLRPLVLVATALVLPGYALLAAWFPPTDERERTAFGALDRLAFAPPLSVAVCTLLGIALLVSPLGLSGITVLGGISVVTVSGAVIRAVRTPSNGRARPALRELSRALHGTIATSNDDEPGDTTESDGDRDAVTMAIAGLVIAASVSGAGATAVLLGVHEPAGYAEISITPANATGNESFDASDTVEVTLTHHGAGSSSYTVEAVGQRLEPGSNLTVADARSLDRFDVTLGDGETWSTRHRPTLPWNDERVRVAYRLSGADASTGDGDPPVQVHYWPANGSGTTSPAETTNAPEAAAASSITNSVGHETGASAP